MGRNLTITDAAEALGKSTRTLRRWIAAGRLDAARIGGRLSISPASLEAFLAKSNAASTAREFTLDARLAAARSHLRRRHRF